jgi:hypothetical protein
MAAENAKRHAARQAGVIFGHSDMIPGAIPRDVPPLPALHTFWRNFPQPF